MCIRDSGRAVYRESIRDYTPIDRALWAQHGVLTRVNAFVRDARKKRYRKKMVAPVTAYGASIPRKWVPDEIQGWREMS